MLQSNPPPNESDRSMTALTLGPIILQETVRGTSSLETGSEMAGGNMQRRFAITIGLLFAGLLVVGNLEVEAQAARVSLTVNDVEGEPVEGVTVTITCPAKPELRIVKATNAKGKVAITHIDSLQRYTYTFEKEGYQTYVTQVQPDYTETTRLEIVLRPREMAEAGGQEDRQQPGGGRALAAFNEGTEAQQRGDLELAERKFRQAAEISPDSPEPRIALAVVAHQRGDYAAAAAEAEAALAISPTNEQALLLRFDAYRKQGDAAKVAEAADALRREGAAPAAAATLFNEGLEHHRDGDDDAALTAFRSAVELDPGLVNGYLMIGAIALGQGDPEQAAAMASKALELDGDEVNALKLRYDAARTLGDGEAARAALDALTAADPEWASTDLFNHAVELYNADDMAGAATALRKVVELRPDDARAHFLLGMAELNLGETGEARSHLNRFLELAPDDSDAALAREMLQYVED